MDQVNQTLENIKQFLMSPAGMYTMLAVIIFLIIVLIWKYKEGFEGVVEGLNTFAEYPKTFSEYILPIEETQIKDIAYDNYFVKATETVMPNAPQINQLELETTEDIQEKTPEKTVELPKMKVDAPVDLGNGVVAVAKVSIPAQTVDVPSQTPVVLPEPEKTNIEIKAQTVTIPEQEGVIPTKIEGSDASVTIPVKIPEQTITVESQQSIVPVVEPFRV